MKACREKDFKWQNNKSDSFSKRMHRLLQVLKNIGAGQRLRGMTGGESGF